MLPSALETCWQEEEGMAFEKWACCILGYPNTTRRVENGSGGKGLLSHWNNWAGKSQMQTQTKHNPDETHTQSNMSHASLPQWPLAMTVMQPRISATVPLMPCLPHLPGAGAVFIWLRNCWKWFDSHWRQVCLCWGAKLLDSWNGPVSALYIQND